MTFRDDLAQVVRSVGLLLSTPARLAEIKQAYSDLGTSIPVAYAMDLEDTEARVRAITGCTPAQARAHVKAAHRLVWEGLTDDPCGFAVRTLASGGELLGQEEFGGRP